MRIEKFGDCEIRLGDFREVISPDEFSSGVVITDPPYNVGYGYSAYRDNLSDDEYWDMLDCLTPYPSVFIHYPEALFRLAYLRGQFPDKMVAWVYNANTPKQWRGICWFGVQPDFSLAGQPYKNPKDKRIAALIAKGKQARLYDWWEVQQVKNVSHEKTDHPCQIPKEVMRRIVAITPAGRIIDPFSGSGATALAAAEAGVAFLGSEIDPQYFDIICRQLERVSGMLALSPRAGEQ